MLRQKTDNILMHVEKPARYTGGELNSVIKNPAEVKIRYAFCFADVYEVGMSHLGMKILYHVLNERDDTWCERVFAPWVDMEEQMRKTFRFSDWKAVSPLRILTFWALLLCMRCAIQIL